MQLLNQFKHYWSLIVHVIFFDIFSTKIGSYRTKLYILIFLFSNVHTQNTPPCFTYVAVLYLPVSINKLCDDHRILAIRFWYFIGSDLNFLNNTVYLKHKSNIYKMNNFISFLYLHIFFALFDRMFQNCQKLSYQFLVCTLFLKIPVLAEVSLYQSPILHKIFSKIFTISEHFIITLSYYAINANKHLTQVLVS